MAITKPTRILFPDNFNPQEDTPALNAALQETYDIVGGLAGLSHAEAHEHPVVEFGAQLTGNQSIPDNTDTTVVYDQEDTDTDGLYNPATGIFTVPTGLGGKWLVSAGVAWAANASGLRRLGLYRNGTTSRVAGIRFPSAIAAQVEQVVSRTIRLADGDTIRARVLQTVGGGTAIDVVAGVFTFFDCTRLGD